MPNGLRETMRNSTLNLDLLDSMVAKSFETSLQEEQCNTPQRILIPASRGLIEGDVPVFPVKKLGFLQRHLIIIDEMQFDTETLIGRD